MKNFTKPIISFFKKFKELDFLRDDYDPDDVSDDDLNFLNEQIAHQNNDTFEYGEIKAKPPPLLQQQSETSQDAIVEKVVSSANPSKYDEPEILVNGNLEKDDIEHQIESSRFKSLNPDDDFLQIDTQDDQDDFFLIDEDQFDEDNHLHNVTNPIDIYDVSFEDDEEISVSRVDNIANIQTTGKITREQRAEQVALDILAKYEWDEDYLPLLQSIFYQNGWAMCRVAIEREINNGMQADELELAHELRVFWSQSSHFWLAFQNSSGSLGYPCQILSWSVALRIIRCYHNLPDIEELYDFIDRQYERWQLNPQLQQSFYSFYAYIYYRTGAKFKALSQGNFYSIADAPEKDTDEIQDVFYSGNNITRELLSEFGFDIKSLS